MTGNDTQKLHNQANPSLSQPSVLLATWFGAGYLPKAPGTWGSLAALPFAWLIMTYSGPWMLLGATCGVFLVGIWAANGYMKRSGNHDPGPVVIDEVAGQWMTLILVPVDLSYYVLGFVLFRLADIFKPWPASWADKKVDGGIGVMLDDILAAFYSGGILYLMYRMEVI